MPEILFQADPSVVSWILSDCPNGDLMADAFVLLTSCACRTTHPGCGELPTSLYANYPTLLLNKRQTPFIGAEFLPVIISIFAQANIIA